MAFSVPKFKIKNVMESLPMFSFRPKIKRKVIVDTLPKLKKLVEKMDSLQEFAYDTETNTLRVLGDNKKFKLVGISISWGEYDNYYIPLGHARWEDVGRQIPLSTAVKYLKRVFEKENIRIIGWNLKFDMHVLARVGIFIKTKDLFDGMIASWLCNENTPNGLKPNSAEKLGIEQEHFAEVTSSVPNEVKKEFGLKSNNKATFDLVLIDEGAPYALDDSFLTWELYLGYLDLLEESKMDKIYFKSYAPFLRTLFEMEEVGVLVNMKRLKEMSIEINKDMEEMLYKMFEITGVEFNPGSSQQLGELLFGYQKPLIAPWDVTHDSKHYKWGSASEKEKAKMKKEYEKKLAIKEESPLIRHSFNFRVLSSTPAGAPQCNGDTFWNISKMAFKTTKKKEGVRLCSLLMEYSKLSKLRSAFIDGLFDKLYDDGRAHPSFNIIGTDSGRISCIAKDTPIKVLGGDKPIQDVKVGDLVYCYDDKGDLRIRRVLKVMNNGVRPCVKVHWVSQGSHDKGELICTPDHQIRLADGNWVRADELEPNVRITHLRTSKEKRPRLYGLQGFCEQEQLFIKKEIFGVADPNVVIHHIDGNQSNNSLNNLKLEGRSYHSFHHTKDAIQMGIISPSKAGRAFKPNFDISGSKNPNYMEVTKEYLEYLVIEAEGIITNIPMDFNTFKKKCKEVDFNYKEVACIYQKQYKEVSDTRFTEVFYECKGIPYAISQSLNIGRVRVQKTIQRLDLCFNHKILEVVPFNSMQVYDLEVEDCHNFIANEVCVHNCSEPNLQQLPKAEEDDKYQIRSLFIGSQYVADKDGNYLCEIRDYKGTPLPSQIKRKKIVAVDFANLEMRVLAHFSEDDNLLRMFKNGDDSHGSTAVNMFELDCDPHDVKKLFPHLRQAAKIINFLLMYGGGAYSLYTSLKEDHFSPIDLGDKSYLETYHVKRGQDVAQIYIDKYFSTYSGVAKFIKNQKRYAHKHGFVYTLLRRKRRLPDINSPDFGTVSYNERLSVNSCVQGSAADITSSAQNKVNADPWFNKNGAFMNIQVHDELVFECPEENVDECIERAKKYMSHPFGEGVELNVPLESDADSGWSYQEAK